MDRITVPEWWENADPSDFEGHEDDADGAVAVDYSIRCYECDKLLRTVEGKDIEDIHTASNDEDVCANCCDVCAAGGVNLDDDYDDGATYCAICDAPTLDDFDGWVQVGEMAWLCDVCAMFNTDIPPWKATGA